MQAQYLEAAADELREAINFYNSRQAGLGERFREQVELAVHEVCEHPQRCAYLAQDVQRQRVQTFPYDVLFTAGTELILVVAIMHHHREPNYWKPRLA